MTDRTWMKKCCGMCPFAKENTLDLHPERAEEFAYMAQNPFTDFPCHKTADFDEDERGDGERAGYVHGENSYTCHGFKTLQMAETSTEEQRKAAGFEPDGKGFEDVYDMIDHHQELWDQKN